MSYQRTSKSLRGQPPGITVQEALGAPVLAGATVLAGAAGLNRMVVRIGIMEVADILPWVKSDELLLTTAYPFRENPEAFTDLVGELDDQGLAGICIKLGRYIDAIPEKVLRRADELGFPLIQLPPAAGFGDILQQVLPEILNRHATRLARSDNIHRSLLQIVLSGGGLNEIAADLTRLLDRPIAIISPDGLILAASGLDQVLDTLTASGALHEDGRLLMTDSHGVVTSSGESPADYLGVPIVARGVMHGHIVALQGEPQFSDYDILALESAVTVAALAIAHSREVALVEARFRADFLYDLLDGRVDSAGEAIERAVSLGWDLDRPTIVLVGETDAEPAEKRAIDERVAALFEASLRSKDPAAAAVHLNRGIVTITGAPSGNTRQQARSIASELALETRQHENASVSIGVSRVLSDPLDVAEGYHQAATALRIGRRLFGPGNAVHFDDLGAYRLLSLIEDEEELLAFAEEMLGPLTRRTQQAADLRCTLSVILEANGNVAEAARRLHFHYNTLRYRIIKLRELVGPFPEDPEVRLNVTLALRILELVDSQDGRRGAAGP